MTEGMTKGENNIGCGMCSTCEARMAGWGKQDSLSGSISSGCICTCWQQHGVGGWEERETKRIKMKVWETNYELDQTTFLVYFLAKVCEKCPNFYFLLYFLKYNEKRGPKTTSSLMIVIPDGVKED